MSRAPTRRGLLAGSAATALGLAAGVAPALATMAPNYPGNSEVADAALIAEANAFRSLCARESQAWHDLDDDDQDGETPALTVCRALSQACRDAGEALAETPATTAVGLAAKAPAMLALTGPRLDTQAELIEHDELVVSILRDAVQLGGGAHA